MRTMRPRLYQLRSRVPPRSLCRTSRWMALHRSPPTMYCYSRGSEAFSDAVCQASAPPLGTLSRKLHCSISMCYGSATYLTYKHHLRATECVSLLKHERHADSKLGCSAFAQAHCVGRLAYTVEVQDVRVAQSAQHLSLRLEVCESGGVCLCRLLQDLDCHRGAAPAPEEHLHIKHTSHNSRSLWDQRQFISKHLWLLAQCITVHTCNTAVSMILNTPE